MFLSLNYKIQSLAFNKPMFFMAAKHETDVITTNNSVDKVSNITPNFKARGNYTYNQPNPFYQLSIINH